MRRCIVPNHTRFKPGHHTKLRNLFEERWSRQLSVIGSFHQIHDRATLSIASDRNVAPDQFRYARSAERKFDAIARNAHASSCSMPEARYSTTKRLLAIWSAQTTSATPVRRTAGRPVGDASAIATKSSAAVAVAESLRAAKLAEQQHHEVWEIEHEVHELALAAQVGAVVTNAGDHDLPHGAGHGDGDRGDSPDGLHVVGKVVGGVQDAGEVGDGIDAKLLHVVLVGDREDFDEEAHWLLGVLWDGALGVCGVHEAQHDVESLRIILDDDAILARFLRNVSRHIEREHEVRTAYLEVATEHLAEDGRVAVQHELVDVELLPFTLECEVRELARLEKPVI